MAIVFNVDSGTVEQVTAIIMSGASLIAYILAEGWADGKNTSSGAADDVGQSDTYAIGFDAGTNDER